MRILAGRRVGLVLGLGLGTALLTAAAGGASDPLGWPEEERAFLQDGPGWLLTNAEREALLAMKAEERAAWIAAFLARDPFPETPGNELTEALARRTAEARALFVSPADVRYRLYFLAGRPLDRQPIDCGMTYKDLEVWSYAPGSLAGGRAVSTLQTSASATQEDGKRRFFSRKVDWPEAPKIVLYRAHPGSPFQLWQPFDSKRVLYRSEMEYLLQQYEELRNLISSPPFDQTACPETRLIEKATGVEGLFGFLRGRPTAPAIESFLAPPADLGRWVREALAEPATTPPPVLQVEPLTLLFPDVRGQMMATRVLINLPAAPPLEASFEGKIEVLVEGVLESEDRQIFGETRARFETAPVEPGGRLSLALDQALRPGAGFVVRLKITDEVSRAEAWVAKAFRVPDEPQEGDRELATAVSVQLGQQLAREAAVEARDALLLAPPLEGQVNLGLWRAQALVTGSRIRKVVFLVDGKPQQTRQQPPWEAELRLATFPTEQIVRAEGYDDADELVAADEVVLNQPRGAFRVSLVEPPAGVKTVGQVLARAEVVVPDERTVVRVEFKINDQVVATLNRPPWQTAIAVPAGQETTYLSAVAVLDDGHQVEDVRFLNAPEYVEELDVRLVELYTTVSDRSGRLVQGLGEGEFTILEGGKPQTIAKFEKVENLPLVVGIAIDTSGSMASSLVEAQQAGRNFLARVVGRQDRCYVVGFSGKPTLLMPPTDDVGACTQGIEGLQAVGTTALHDALVTSLYYSRELSGQKALILLSDGDDTASSISFPEALEFARRSGVAIYAIGLNVSELDLRIRRKLAALAEETGGRVFHIDRAEELEGVYSEIERELRSRYLLAFASNAKTSAGEFREVEVKVKGSGLKARTVRGYYR